MTHIPSPQHGPPRPSVVLVDDDPDLLRALVFRMETEGFRVAAFATADAILDLPAAPDTDCLVVDHNLPRTDGLFLIEMLRARGLTAPAILIASRPGAMLRARCESLAVPIVEKPLLDSALLDAVRRAAVH